MRFAIYFAPGPDSPLGRLGAAWLGRDAFSGEAIESRAAAGLSAAQMSAWTAEPRRYGFHATLKAPFRMAETHSQASLEAALAAFACATPAVPPLQFEVRQIDGFFALVPADDAPGLYRLADEVVSTFDRFRAPISEAEIARRNPDGLSLRQLQYLRRWGYPHVFQEFRFHMTLTGRVKENADADRLRNAIDEAFSAALETPVAVNRVALFIEPAPGEPFTVAFQQQLSGDVSG